MKRNAQVPKRRPMGALESEVLEQLWAMPVGGTPAEVLEALDTDLAYTTIMTILTRLWEKGLATRERHGKAYVYSAAVTEAELAAQRMQATLASTVNRKAALLKFVETLPARESRALRAALGELPQRRCMV